MLVNVRNIVALLVNVRNIMALLVNVPQTHTHKKRCPAKKNKKPGIRKKGENKKRGYFFESFTDSEPIVKSILSLAVNVPT